MISLTQKETSLLQDAQKHEQHCVEKYKKNSETATDPQLKSLFTSLGQKEQEHLNTINQILGGTVPNINAGQSSQNQPKTAQPMQNSSNQTSQIDKQKDSFLCQDVLSTEKYVSSTYDTAIFEFKDPNIRQVLNHIQKEEQEHGQQIYDYMSQNGMYN